MPNRLIRMIRKLSRPLSARHGFPIAASLLLILILVLSACRVIPFTTTVTTSSQVTSNTMTDTTGQPTTSGSGTSTADEGTATGTTDTSGSTGTSGTGETAGSSLSPTPSSATTGTFPSTSSTTQGTGSTPTPSTTTKPTSTPPPTSTATPTHTPTNTPTSTVNDFPYRNYGTLFRDDYGENSSIVSSEDGGILIDTGCSAYGVSLLRVDSIPADTRCKAIVSANGSSYQYDILARGKYVGLPLQLGNGTYKISVYEEIAPSSFSIRFAYSYGVSLASSLKPYTASSLMCDFSRGSNCVQKANTLCSGIGTATGRVDAVYGWIVANIDYDRALANSITSGEVKTYVPNPEKTYSTRKGICFDYASLMCAMLRSQGIPTRLVVGQTPLGYHAWNEVYFAGQGWVIVASFSWAYIDGSGWVMFDSTFAAGGMTPESIQDITHTKQKTY